MSGLEEVAVKVGPITRDAQENGGKGGKSERNGLFRSASYAYSGLGCRVIYTVLLLFKTSCFVKDIDIPRLSISLTSITIEMSNPGQ